MRHASRFNMLRSARSRLSVDHVYNDDDALFIDSLVFLLYFSTFRLINSQSKAALSQKHFDRRTLEKGHCKNCVWARGGTQSYVKGYLKRLKTVI